MRRLDGNSKAMVAAAVMAISLIFNRAAVAQQPQVPSPKRVIVVSIPDRKLALLEDERVVKIYDVAVGRDVSPTPAGTFTIVNRVTNPAYYHEGKVIPPGKTNPVGARWMGLSKKHYAIHGTDEPRSIGKAASHGCVRMNARDVADLFRRVRVGDTVEIHGERDAQVAQIFADAPVVTAQVDPAAAAGGGR